jgi:hypothetical protein
MRAAACGLAILKTYRGTWLSSLSEPVGRAVKSQPANEVGDDVDGAVR